MGAFILFIMKIGLFSFLATPSIMAFWAAFSKKNDEGRLSPLILGVVLLVVAIIIFNVITK